MGALGWKRMGTGGYEACTAQVVGPGMYRTSEVSSVIRLRSSCMLLAVSVSLKVLWVNSSWFCAARTGGAKSVEGILPGHQTDGGSFDLDEGIPQYHREEPVQLLQWGSSKPLEVNNLKINQRYMPTF